MEQKNRGRIPLSGKIIMETGTEDWDLIQKKLIKELQTKAIVKNQHGEDIRISIRLKDAYELDPDAIQAQDVINANLGIEISLMLTRLYDTLYYILETGSWILTGFVEGKEEKKIVIKYIKEFGICLYALKSKKDKIKTGFDLSGQKANLN